MKTNPISYAAPLENIRLISVEELRKTGQTPPTNGKASHYIVVTTKNVSEWDLPGGRKVRFQSAKRSYAFPVDRRNMPPLARILIEELKQED